MKREIHPGIIAGVIAVVVVVVVALAWKAIAGPGPAGFKSFTPEQVKAVNKQHAQSVQDMQEQQRKLLQQRGGGQ